MGGSFLLRTVHKSKQAVCIVHHDRIKKYTVSYFVFIENRRLFFSNHLIYCNIINYLV